MVVFVKILQMLLKCVDPLKAVTDFTDLNRNHNILCLAFWEIFKNRHLIEILCLMSTVHSLCLPSEKLQFQENLGCFSVKFCYVSDVTVQ